MRVLRSAVTAAYLLQFEGIIRIPQISAVENRSASGRTMFFEVGSLHFGGTVTIGESAVLSESAGAVS